jgi:NADH:ubiquinone oxidoreductase subunit B-like Fe-S oxidoreductase
MKKQMMGLSSFKAWMLRYALKEQLIAHLANQSCCGSDLALFVEGDKQLIWEHATQSDILFVSGPVSQKFLPELLEIYHSMPEHRVVVLVGSCTINGGVLRNPLIVDLLQTEIQIDVVVPGCPVQPAVLENAIAKIDLLIQQKLGLPGLVESSL